MIRCGDTWIDTMSTNAVDGRYPCDALGWVNAREHTPRPDAEITAQMRNGKRYTDRRSAFLWSAVVAWQPAPMPYDSTNRT